jgi:branched-chain amino acid aminotransferase
VRAYETAQGPAIFRLREHTRRLFNSAKIFQMKIPYEFEQVLEAQKEVVRANGLKSCYLRPIAWIGSEKMGVSAKGNTIHVAIAAWPWGAYLGEDGLAKGIRVKTSSFTRHHVNVSLVRAKASGYYINSILANQEVTAHGYDEALLLDTEATCPRAAARTCSSSRRASSTRPTSPRAWTASRATPSSRWRATWGWR